MDGGEGDCVRRYLQGIAAGVLVLLALAADGAMDTWGVKWFTIVYSVALLICVALVFRGGPPKPPRKRNRPRRCDLRERRDQPTWG